MNEESTCTKFSWHKPNLYRHFKYKSILKIYIYVDSPTEDIHHLLPGIMASIDKFHKHYDEDYFVANFVSECDSSICMYEARGR